MECNKDEAIRAKDIAVRKFTEKDFAGAKKFALKAQTLYPPLEGISQMLTTLDIYISAENKSGGETDFYSVLGVNPLADDDTIKKQYRKLVLLLHPDKNQSIGADGAFLLVTDAFNVLSDKAKRSAYNTRRHIRIAERVSTQAQHTFRKTTVDLKVPAGGIYQPPCNIPSPDSPLKVKVPSRSGVNGCRKRQKSQKGGTLKESQKGESSFTGGDTFWTCCLKCKMQYEYSRIYLGQWLKCPSCEVGFMAVEIPPPSNLAPPRPPDKQRKAGPQVSGVNISFDGGASARWHPYGTTGCNIPIPNKRKKV